jgi:hypothetical protein
VLVLCESKSISLQFGWNLEFFVCWFMGLGFRFDVGRPNNFSVYHVWAAVWRIIRTAEDSGYHGSWWLWSREWTKLWLSFVKWEFKCISCRLQPSVLVYVLVVLQ